MATPGVSPVPPPAPSSTSTESASSSNPSPAELAAMVVSLRAQVERLNARQRTLVPETREEDSEDEYIGKEEAEEQAPAGGRKADIERQRRVVHNSRQSISNLAAAAITQTFNNNYSSLDTPLRPPAVQQSRSSFVRRLSRGQPSDELELQDDVDLLPSALSFDAVQMKRDEYHRYEVAAKQLTASVTKFHGNRVKDGDRTVHEFVQLINAEMDAWMGSAQRGRLNLVIGRTDGTAQNWLVKKRDELAKLRAAGLITDVLVSEWHNVTLQQDFIDAMSKGITPTMYEVQLRALRVKDKDGKWDPTTFIRKFDEITSRLHPLSNWAMERDRNRFLAREFSERVKYGGGQELWALATMMLSMRGVKESERSLDEWQGALLEAWSIQQGLGEGGTMFKSSIRFGTQRENNFKGQSQPPSNQSRSQSVNAINTPAEDDQDDDTEQEERKGQGLSAVGTHSGSARKSGKQTRNPHLSPAQVGRLRENGLCLSCYKPNHFARDCNNPPANRAPTEAELKVKAGQRN